MSSHEQKSQCDHDLEGGVVVIAFLAAYIVTAMSATLLRSLVRAKLARRAVLMAMFVLAWSAFAGALAHLSRPSQQRNSAAVSSLEACDVFPPDNIWNTRIDDLPLDPRSYDYVNAIGAARSVHLDLSIPYNAVAGGTSQRVLFDDPSQSDPGPYHLPVKPLIEEGSDHHVLVVDTSACVLYELFGGRQNSDATWRAASGAIFDLRSNRLRARDWTSADAAGLPILTGLLRYDELSSGSVRHAIRFTAPRTRAAYVWPARHRASRLTSDDFPPMGQRFRLRADFPVARFSKQAQVILTALKVYGLVLADNGSPWFLSGAPDARWNEGALQDEFRRVRGSDFEALDESSLMVDVDSGQARRSKR